MSDTRTLRVVIAGDAKGARGEISGLNRDLDRLGDEADDASGRWGKFSEKVKTLGGVFRKTGDAAHDSIKKIDTRGLDAQLVEVHQRVIELDKQFALTGDRDIFKKLRQDRGLLTQLRKVRTEIAQADGTLGDLVKSGGKLGLALGTNVGEAASKGLGASFNSLPPQAQAGILAAGAGLAATLGPLIGGVIAGAVIGGVGIGGVAGGVAIAAQHPAVKAAAVTLGGVFKETMQNAASAFVPETVKSLGTITTEVKSLGGDFQRIFSQAARYVQPLTNGMIGFVRNLLPGVETLMAKAGPVIDEIASWGPKLGSLLSEIFTLFADNAFNASRALAAFWFTLAWGIRLVAWSINSMATLYGWFEKLGLILSGNITKAIALGAAEGASKQETQGLSDSLAQVVSVFGAFSGATSNATEQVELVGDAIRRFANDNLSARAAVRGAEEAVDAASAAFKKNGATLDVTKAKGRENQAALDKMAESYWTAYDATLKQTGSQEQANAVLSTGRARFIAMADKMGLTATQAVELANKMFGLPNVNRTITVKQQQAIDAIAAVTNNLKGVKSKNISIGVWWIEHGRNAGSIKVPGGTQLKAVGGLMRGPGTGTSDSIFTRLSNGEYVLRAAAVRRLGVGFLDTLNQADRPGKLSHAFDSMSSNISAASSRGLADRSIPAQGPSEIVQVIVTVEGSVTAERDLAKAIATTVRDEIARKGKRNGGRTGL